MAFDALGIDGALDVAFDHADAELFSQPFDGSFEQRGLACAGRAHEVDHEHAGFVEHRRVFLRDAVVGFQDVANDANGAHTTSISTICSSRPAIVSPPAWLHWGHRGIPSTTGYS